MKTAIRLLIYGCICLACLQTYLAQTDSLPRYKNQVKVSPLRYFIGMSKGVQVSYQYNAGKRYATEIMALYVFNPQGQGSFYEQRDLYGYGFGLAQKKYIDFWRRSRDYLSVDFTLLNYHYRTTLGFKEANSTTQSYRSDYLDTVLVNRTISLLNFRVGEEWRYKRLLLEVNFGMGLRYRYVTHAEKLNSGDRMASPRHPNVGHALHADGSYLTLNFPASFKIGFCF